MLLGTELPGAASVPGIGYVEQGRSAAPDAPDSNNPDAIAPASKLTRAAAVMLDNTGRRRRGTARSLPQGAEHDLVEVADAYGPDRLGEQSQGRGAGDR